jgi:hypothetical protein
MREEGATHASTRSNKAGALVVPSLSSGMFTWLRRGRYGLGNPGNVGALPIWKRPKECEEGATHASGRLTLTGTLVAPSLS